MSQNSLELNLISEFNKLDLQNTVLSRKQWLQTHPKRQTPRSQNSKGETNLEHLATLTEEQVDLMIMKLKRNHDNYQKWIEQKRVEKEKLMVERERQKLLKMEREFEKEKERKIKMEKIKRAREMWDKQKEGSMLRQKAVETAKKIKYNQEEEQRRKLAEKAYEEWLKKSASRDNDEKIVLPKKSWISPLDPSSQASLKISAKSNLLSPPNLYKDYDLYQKYTPGFIKKYPLLVSRAGIEELSSSGSLKVKAKARSVSMKPNRAINRPINRPATANAKSTIRK